MAKTSTAARAVVAVRNPMAGSLANAAFRNRIVKPKAGRGSYSRKAKHAGRADY